jgi:hypothetical protein
MAAYADIRPWLPYHLGVAGGGPAWPEIVAGRSAVYETETEAAGVRLRPAGLFDPPAPAGEPLAHFGNGVSLLAAEGRSGEAAAVTLTWQAGSAALAGPATVFVHLLDEAGQLVAQDDGPPLAGTYPFALWAAGQVVADARVLDRPGAAVLVGLYDPATGERLPAMDAAGAPLADDAVRLPLLGD